MSLKEFRMRSLRDKIELSGEKKLVVKPKKAEEKVVKKVKKSK